jgi:hypothetical protein
VVRAVGSGDKYIGIGAYGTAFAQEGNTADAIAAAPAQDQETISAYLVFEGFDGEGQPLLTPLFPPEEETIPAWALEAAAQELYDALETPGGDLASLIRDIAQALHFYQGPDVSEASIVGLIEEGMPVILEDQVEAIARGYRSGVMVKLDNFIETLVEDWGSVGKQPPGPLTRQHLTDGFAELVTKDHYNIGEVLPAGR